jgi:ribosomal protein S18 acetylase RimI-like enzyme
VTGAAGRSPPAVKLRRGRRTDLDALVALEQAIFTTDRLSRRSFRHFLAAPHGALIVAELGGKAAGYALVLYPPRSELARLYSIAVAPHRVGRGVGALLLAAAERAARRRGRRTMRLEVHEHNSRAIALYEKAAYRRFGCHADYYADHADALRFAKALTRAGPERATPSLRSPHDSAARIAFHGAYRPRRSRQSF